MLFHTDPDNTSTVDVMRDDDDEDDDVVDTIHLTANTQQSRAG